MLQRDGMHGCRKLASFGKRGRARLQRRDQFHEQKSNPGLFHVIYRYMTCGTGRTRGLLISNSRPTRPRPRKKQGTRDGHASPPLMRADAASLAHLRAQQPGRVFRLPEISIEYIMHLGLPSGEISESGLRRFTPPPPQPSSLPPLHHRHHHALALLVAVLPLGRGPFRCPAMSPPRRDRLVASLPRSCHISQAVAPHRPTSICQCWWLWLHWLGYPIRQYFRRPGQIALQRMPYQCPLRRYCPLFLRSPNLYCTVLFRRPELSGRMRSRQAPALQRRILWSIFRADRRGGVGNAACGTLVTGLFATCLGVVCSRLQSAAYQKPEAEQPHPRAESHSCGLRGQQAAQHAVISVCTFPVTRI